MYNIQKDIWETNLYLDHSSLELVLTLIHTGWLYQLKWKTLDIPITSGILEDIDRDYVNWNGIGGVIPEIKGFAVLLKDMRSATEWILKIHKEHARTLNQMTWLCFDHVLSLFPWESSYSRGWLFCIQITARSATLQILYNFWHGHYLSGHQISLEEISENGIQTMKPPFSHVPLDITIPDKQWKFQAMTFEGWKKLLAETPYNTLPHQMYRSRTQDVLSAFEKLVEKLMNV